MPTFFELFYERLRSVVAKYREHLTDDEANSLLNAERARAVFSSLPAYVSAIDGLADALAEKDPVSRAKRIEHACLNSPALPLLFDRDRLDALPQADKQFLGSVLSAFYYLSISASTRK